MNWYNPTVVDHQDKGERSLDLASSLLQERTIFLFDEISDHTARLISAQLMILESKSDSPIRLYINSPGGSVYSAMCILDTIEQMRAPVHTIILGIAASAAALLAIYGGERFMTANSRMMIHQPLGGTRGQASEIAIYYEEINKIKIQINNIIVSKSNLTYEQIEQMTDRDTYLSAEECKQHGFIDNIIGKPFPTEPIKNKQ